MANSMESQKAGTAAALAVRVFPTTMGFKVTSGFSLQSGFNPAATSPTSPFAALQSHSANTDDLSSPLACTPASGGNLGPDIELQHTLRSEVQAPTFFTPPLTSSSMPLLPLTSVQADECSTLKHQAAPSRSTSTSSFISYMAGTSISQAAAAPVTESSVLPRTPLTQQHERVSLRDHIATSAPTPTALPACSSFGSSITSGSQGCPWVRLANEFYSSSQLAIPVMLTPPSQQKHVGWEGLLAFSKASGCSGVVAGAHSLVSARRQHRSSIDEDIHQVLLNSNVRVRNTSTTPSAIPAVPDEPYKIEICCTAHPTIEARHLLKSVVQGLKSCQDPEVIAEGMGGAYFCLNEHGRKTAIIKPCDEEALAPNNPKGVIGHNLGDPGWKPTVRVGEAAMREVAACLLDHGHFANVPTTVLVRARHPVFCYRSKMPSVGSSMIDLTTLTPNPTPAELGSDTAASDDDCGVVCEQEVEAEAALVSNCSSAAASCQPQHSCSVTNITSNSGTDTTHPGSSDLDSVNLMEMLSRESTIDVDAIFWKPASLSSQSLHQPTMHVTSGFPLASTVPVSVGFNTSHSSVAVPGSLPLSSSIRLPRPVSSGLLSLAAAASFEPSSRMSGSFVSSGLAARKSAAAASTVSLFDLAASKKILPMKLASLQEFISHECDTTEMGCGKFSTGDVHRIGILDIRLFNTDRHAGNMLCVPNSSAKGLAGTRSSGVTDLLPPHHQQKWQQGYSLVPIDHGFCLPEALEAAYFEWQHWPQASIPFSEEELAYIDKLDVLADKDLLIKELPNLRAECLRVMEVSTTLLKMCAMAGLSLCDVAGIMERQRVDGVEEASGLELACAAANLDLEERAAEESDSDGEEADTIAGEYDDTVSSMLERSSNLTQPVQQGQNCGVHLEDMLFDLDDDASGHAAQNTDGVTRRTSSAEIAASLSSSPSSDDSMSLENMSTGGGSSRLACVPSPPASLNVPAPRGITAGAQVAHSVHLSEGYLRRNVTGGQREVAGVKAARKGSVRKPPSPVSPLSAEALRAIFSDMEEPTWVKFMASLRTVLKVALDSGAWKQSYCHEMRAMSCPS